jgi:hypothetical protein
MQSKQISTNQKNLLDWCARGIQRIFYNILHI